MRNQIAVILLGSILFVTACSKDGATGPQGPQGPGGPSFTGIVSGHVWLYDQYGTRLDTGLAGVQVRISNSSKDTTVISDASGAFTFTNISTGNYTLSAHSTNNAYGDTKTQNVQFLKDTLNRDIKMSAIPNFSPTSFTATLSSSGYDSLIFTFNADAHARTFIVFANNSSTVNGLPANYLLVYGKNLPANQTKIGILIPASDFRDAGISSGATVYYAAYGFAVNDVSGYEDFTTGKIVYDALSSTPLFANAVAP